MPTEEENTQYLYLVLTHGGNPKVDWDAVGTAMDLKKGAVSKRWSRLKKSMEAGETPAGSVYKFLWLCVKHSTRDKALDWNAIAEKCGTTSGAASKRYFRMKQAFDAGAEPPASGPSSPGGAKTPAKATPKKGKAAVTDGEGTPTPKRKRAPARKVKEEVKEEDDGDDAEQVTSPKKPRVTKKKSVIKSKAADEDTSATEEASQVKSEAKEEEGRSVDVNQWVGDLVDAGEVVA